MIRFINEIAPGAMNSAGATFVGIGLTKEEIAALADPETRTPIVVPFKRACTVLIFLAEQSDAIVAEIEKIPLLDTLSMHSNE